MISSDMNDIFLLLAVGIYADKKLYASEVEIFVKSVSRIKLSTVDNAKVSEAKALAWFEMNRADVKSKFDLPRSDFDEWFIPILKRIRKHAELDALKHMLQMIFLADNEVHVSEIALMTLVEREWGIQ